MSLRGYYHEGAVELEPVEQLTGYPPPSTHAPLQRDGTANQEVAALLILYLGVHHFIVQRALS